MSLLMQALKKAEQAKQKQNDVPIITEPAELAEILPPVETKKVILSLDIDDSHLHASNNFSKESEKSTPILEQNNASLPKHSLTELSLTPHQDDRVENKAVDAQATLSETTSHISSHDAEKSDVQLSTMESSLATQNNQVADGFFVPVQVTNQANNQANNQATNIADVPQTIDAPNVANAANAANIDNAVNAINAAEISTNIEAKKVVEELEHVKKQITNPKIDVEQKELIEKANQARILDQQKARAVFSSKTPSNTLRLKWLSIVAIAVVVALIGFAYMVWQKSLANSNQFPVAPPLATTGLEQASQEVAATNSIEEKLPDQLANTAVKTDQSIVQDKLGERQPIPTTDNNAAKINIKSNSPIAVKFEQERVTQERINKASSNQTANDNNATANNRNNSDVKSPKVATQRNKSAMQDELTASDETKKMNSRASSKAMNDTTAIQIRKGTVGAKINPNLVSAYQAYITGDRSLASAQYQKVLQQEPNNRDALLGLAAIALNQRQAEQAGEYYGRLLVLDPNDADAIAGLTSLQQADPVQSESRLKAALNQSPSSGSILFALGNLYAQQSRWSDAQQTYFRAYANTPTNADYAFNLAISLDRLNQRKLAIEYYQRALNLAKTGPGNFNANKVQQRLTQLENIRDN